MNWFLVKATAHIFFQLVVPVAALVYIFTALIWG